MTLWIHIKNTSDAKNGLLLLYVPNALLIQIGSNSGHTAAQIAPETTSIKTKI